MLFFALLAAGFALVFFLIIASLTGALAATISGGKKNALVWRIVPSSDIMR